MTRPPQEITVCHLEVVVMPNGEVICAGRSIGWVTGRNGIGKYLTPVEADLATARAAQQQAERERDEAKSDGPPGRWICQTCGFQVTKAFLRAHDGAVGIDARPVEDVCPNDGTSLRRIIWKEDAADANRVGMEQMQRADTAERALAEAEIEIARLEALLKEADIDPALPTRQEIALTTPPPPVAPEG